MVIVSLVITAIAAFLPTLIWLVFFLREDRHPEPRRLIAYTLSVGALVSVPTLLVQLVYNNLLGSGANFTFASVLGLALIEEFFKFFAAYAAIHRDPAFDEPVDAMVYAVTAALGFATVENFFVIGNFANTVLLMPWTDVLQTVALRFIGATLLHTLTSALVGFYWAKGLIQRRVAPSIAIGLVLATALHTAFNFLILRYQNTDLIYPSLFLVFVAFFVLNDFERLKVIPQAAPTGRIS